MPLFDHNVQYASAPVALNLHPSCCYNTVLEVSADHITSLSCSLSLSYSNRKVLFVWHNMSVSCRFSWNLLNTEYTPCLYIKKPHCDIRIVRKGVVLSARLSVTQFLCANWLNEILKLVKDTACEMCEVWWACLRSASLDGVLNDRSDVLPTCSDDTS